MHFTFLISVLLIAWIQFLQAERVGNFVTVYSDIFREGASLNVSISQCSNLPPHWYRTVSSINTRDLCVALFDATNCTGNYIEILPESPAHHLLKDWNFDEMTMSTGPCYNECSSEVIGTGGSLSNTKIEVTLWKYIGWNLHVDEMVVDPEEGCTQIPSSQLVYVKMVKTHRNCVQLYSNSECNAKVGRSVELRRNTPFHDDIAQWEMSHAQSISHCKYKCTNESVRSGSPAHGDVILYAERNLAGKPIVVNVKALPCHEIGIPEKQAIRSVQVGNNTCVNLYDQLGCMGRHISLNKSKWDLAKPPILSEIRSIAACNYHLTDVSESQISTEKSSTESVDKDWLRFTSTPNSTQHNNKMNETLEQNLEIDKNIESKSTFKKNRESARQKLVSAFHYLSYMLGIYVPL